MYFQPVEMKYTNSSEIKAPLLAGEVGASAVDPMAPNDRSIFVNGSTPCYDEKADFASNTVITYRYTMLTFLPLNLIEQFSNLANLFFFFIGLLQLIPGITTTGGTPTMYLTLGFIVTVSGVRAAAEDRTRHISDAARNGYEYTALQNGRFRPIRSGDIQVGQILKIMKDEMIPSDLLLLNSSSAQSHCFIDKSNLNGETKLEVMSAIPEVAAACADEAALCNLQLHLNYGTLRREKRRVQ